MRRLLFRSYVAGLSNCRLSLDIGVGLAMLSDRTLAPFGAQPACSSTSYLPAQAPTIFDLYDLPIPLSKAHLVDPGVDGPDIVTLRWPRVVDSVFCPTRPVSDDPCFVEFSNGRRHVTSFDEASHEAESVCIDVNSLGLYSHYFFLDEVARKRLVDAMRRIIPKPPYAKLATRIAAELGTFNAIHIRRGDFVTQRFTPRAHDVSGNEVLANIAPVLEREVPLLICTDGADDDAFFKPIVEHYRSPVFFDRYLLASDGWRKAFDELPFRSDTVVALLTQLVASKAARFVGTLFSTFTALVHRQRALELGDQSFLFCYSEWKTTGPPFENCAFAPTQDGRFSWNRVLYPVHPSTCSWLREWPECVEAPRLEGACLPEGTVDLRASEATLHRVVYDTAGDHIGWWLSVDGCVSWRLDERSAGKLYRVEIRYSCGAETAGSSYAVSVGGQAVEGTVEATESWKAYTAWVRLGELQIPSGPQQVTVRVLHKPGLAVMNLRALRLVPVVSEA